MRWLKDLIGDFLGYGNCPVCGRSWWRAEIRSGVSADEHKYVVCSVCFDSDVERYDPTGNIRRGGIEIKGQWFLPA